MYCFFDSPNNLLAGVALLGCVQQVCPGLSPEAAVRLELGVNVNAETGLAALYILSTGLKFIWETRLEKKVVVKHMMRAEIEAKVSILRRTRFYRSADIINELLEILD